MREFKYFKQYNDCSADTFSVFVTQVSSNHDDKKVTEEVFHSEQEAMEIYSFSRFLMPLIGSIEEIIFLVKEELFKFDNPYIESKTLIEIREILQKGNVKKSKEILDKLHYFKNDIGDESYYDFDISDVKIFYNADIGKSELFLIEE